MSAVIAAMRYNAKRNIRYRLKDESDFNDGDLNNDENHEYCPTLDDIVSLRKQMEDRIDIYVQEKR